MAAYSEDAGNERKIGPRRAKSLRGDGLAVFSDAATEQDLCKTVMATSKVNWVTTLDCVLTKHCVAGLISIPMAAYSEDAGNKPKTLNLKP